MADISKINTNSTEYNIKDTTARNGLTDRPTSFVGTRLEWNALPVATQVKYSLVNLKGEGVYKNNGTGLEKIADVGGGTSDYTDLTNKPLINGVTLTGNKTTGDLGITASGVGAIPSTDKGANGGVAELDSNGKVPSSQLPSYVDDVLSYASQSAFPATGETGKIYIAENTNKTYRWSGSAYAEISASLALGETSSTAYRGDRGKTAYDHSQTTGNPHGTTASDVGLGNVPNVSTNDQKPTFTKASTRNNIASGEKLSVIMGKIAKFFNDLKTVAFSGSYNDLTNKPTIPTSASGIAYDNTASGLAATDVQGALDEAVEKMGNMRMTKLWENPSPSASFAGQDVTLLSNDYDYLLFIGSNVGNTRTMAFGIVEKGKSGYLCLNTYESTKVVYLGRDITYVNNTKYNIGDCLYVTGASSAVQNTYMIPLTIYGIKTTASVKINAIAMDVSTSADK